ncbi:MAG: hypothetical protein ABIE84_02115 [bacterium]
MIVSSAIILLALADTGSSQPYIIPRSAFRFFAEETKYEPMEEGEAVWLLRLSFPEPRASMSRVTKVHFEYTANSGRCIEESAFFNNQYNGRQATCSAKPGSHDTITVYFLGESENIIAKTKPFQFTFPHNK